MNIISSNLSKAKSFIATLQFKNDKSLLAFSAILVAVTGAAVFWQHWIAWQAGALFLVGTFALPGLWGKKPGVAALATLAEEIIESKGDDGTPPAGGSSASHSTDSAPTQPSIAAAPPSGTFPKGSAIPLQLACAAMLFVVTWFVAACNLTPSDVTKAKTTTVTVMTDIQRACVIANAIFPSKIVTTVCGITDPVSNDVDQLLVSTQAAGAATRRTVPVTCEYTDAGAILCVTPYVFDAGASTYAGSAH